MERRTLSRGDGTFPAWAGGLPSPEFFRLLGALPEGRSVAIVGTRRPTAAADTFAFELARGVATHGIVVWSGGAVGIDRAAHEGALAGDGPTVAVIGSGLDVPFPPQNADVFARIPDRGGGILSPFDDRAEPVPWRFLARNKVLAAAVELLIIVQCGARSGALNAAKCARTLGKVVGVVPHAPWDETGRGCLDELHRGAVPVTSVADVLQLLGVARKAARPLAKPHEMQQSLPLGLDTEAARVFAALASPASAGDLCESLSMSTASVATALLQLELSGAIQAMPGGTYVRAPHGHGT